MKQTPAVGRLAACLMILPLFGLSQEAGKLGTVEGTVVNSLTGEGIRKAEVVLRGSGPAMRGSSQEASTLAASTDADGRFRFQGVAAGMYFISTQKQGFVSARRTGFGPQGIRVAAGQNVSGLEYKLLPQAVITGRVVDDEGDPVQGVNVAVFQRRYMSGKRRWTQYMVATTNDLGEFRLYNLSPAKVLVAAMPAQRVMSGGPRVSQQASSQETQYVQTFHPSGLEADQATIIETQAGQQVNNVDIQLRRGTVFRIRGRIVDSEATGQMRFGVSAIRRDDYVRDGNGSSTRPDGSFEISGLRAGSYNLMATSYDSRPVAGQRRIGLLKVDLSSDMDGVVIELKSAFKVSGTVAVQSANPGEKMDPKNVSVFLTPAEQGMLFGGPSQVVVSSDGTWTAESVIPGVYRVNAMIRGQAGVPSYVAAVTVNGEDRLGKDLDMMAGPVGPIHVKVATDTGTISGTVERSEESGADGRAMAYAVAADERFRSIDAPRMMQVTQDGNFTLLGCRPGEYLVFVFDQFQPGALEDPELLKKLEPKAVKVKAVAGQSTSVQVKMTEWPEEAMLQ